MTATPHTVLHVINTGGPGGAETVCVNIVRNLDRERWNLVVVVPDEGWIFRELEAAGIEAVVIRHRSRIEVFAYARALMKLVRARNVRLVHAHLFGPTVIAAVIGAIARVPVVGTLHGTVDIGERESLRWLKLIILKRAVAKLVFVSEKLRHAMVRKYHLPAARTAVVPNGIAMPASGMARQHREAFRKSVGLTNSEFVFGAVGNLRPEKGYDVLLRAAAQLKSRGLAPRIVVVGYAQPGEAEELRALRTTVGLTEEEVRFVGFREPISAVLPAFDAYVLTSRTEGFSLSLVEAMAAGLASVSTRCGGPEDILEHDRSGLLVSNGDADEIASALASLMRDAALRLRLGQEAQAIAERRFTLRAQVRGYESLYENVLGVNTSG